MKLKIHEGQLLKEHINTTESRPGIAYKRIGISRALLYHWYKQERLTQKNLQHLRAAGIGIDSIIIRAILNGQSLKDSELIKGIINNRIKALEGK